MSDISLFNKTLSLKNLADYPSEGVAFKGILDEHDGVIATVSMTGHQLPTHTAPCNAMAIGIEGEAIFTISSVEHTVKEGEFIIIPANSPHSVTPVNEKFKFLIIKLKK